MVLPTLSLQIVVLSSLALTGLSVLEGRPSRYVFGRPGLCRTPAWHNRSDRPAAMPETLH
eukprot:1489025-Pyramimonas_sp.AAC.1